MDSVNVVNLAIEKGYSVDQNGRIFNQRGERINGCQKNSGYIEISLTHKGKKYYCLVHRLQAYQKYGELIFSPKLVVRHRDGNPSNNSISNILIGNQSDNMVDVPEDIRIKRALHASSFVSKHDKEAIRKFHSKHRSYRKTMKAFGISSKGTLNYIVSRTGK